jgi:hypothetical protein
MELKVNCVTRSNIRYVDYYEDTLRQLLKSQIMFDDYWRLRIVQDFLKDQLTQPKKYSEKRKKYPG